MRIEQEQLDSLNQLDRIEYRLIRNEIREHWSAIDYDFVFLLIIISILSPLFIYTISGEFPYELFNVSITFSVILLFLTVGYNLYCSIMRTKKMEWLDNRYFKVEKVKK